MNLIAYLKQTPGLIDQVTNCHSKDELIEILQHNRIKVSDDALNLVFAALSGDASELTEEELGAVSGGYFLTITWQADGTQLIERTGKNPLLEGVTVNSYDPNRVMNLGITDKSEYSVTQNNLNIFGKSGNNAVPDLPAGINVNLNGTFGDVNMTDNSKITSTINNFNLFN